MQGCFLTSRGCGAWGNLSAATLYPSTWFYCGGADFCLCMFQRLTGPHLPVQSQVYGLTGSTPKPHSHPLGPCSESEYDCISPHHPPGHLLPHVSCNSDFLNVIQTYWCIFYDSTQCSLRSPSCFNVPLPCAAMEHSPSPYWGVSLMSPCLSFPEGAGLRSEVGSSTLGVTLLPFPHVPPTLIAPHSL